VKQALLQAYHKSLMVYFSTPILVTEIWTDRDVVFIEQEGFREIHLLQKYVNRQVVLNVEHSGKPAAKYQRTRRADQAASAKEAPYHRGEWPGHWKGRGEEDRGPDTHEAHTALHPEVHREHDLGYCPRVDLPAL
jgi:hypothetical protein